MYRSMRKFNQECFINAINNIPFDECTILDDIDDMYCTFIQLYTSILDDHAPIKTRFVKNNQVPYMNSVLRKCINQRNMRRVRHFRHRHDDYLRSQYVRWRNRVTREKRISVGKYFDNKCTGDSGEIFFFTVKPFLS